MKQRLKLFSLLPLATFALLVGSLMLPLIANAGSVSSTQHLAGTKHNSSATSSGNLIYHGGPEMDGTTNTYAIFWEPTGSFVSPTYNSLITRYFGDIGSSKLYHINTQYHDSSGNFPSNSVLAGSWVDTASYPSNPISDAQVQAEVTHAQSVKGWRSSIDNIFFVFTAKGENICASFGCSFQVFCAYHGFFGSNSIYATMPYTGTDLAGCGVPSTPNHDIDADSTINVTSHEQNEAATDPLLNAWFDAAGNENGDKCNFNFGPTKSFGGDVKLNTHPYEVQKEWDNAKHACELQGP